MTDKTKPSTCLGRVPLHLHPVEGLPLPGLLALFIAPLSLLRDGNLSVTSPVWKPQVSRSIQTPAELLRVLRPCQSALRPAIGPDQGPVTGGRAGEGRLMIVRGSHRLIHEILRVNGVRGAGRGDVVRICSACLTRVGPGVTAIPVIIGLQYSALGLVKVRMMMVAGVRLLMLLLLMVLMMMKWTLLMMLGRPHGPVHSNTARAPYGAPVQPSIPGVHHAVTSRPIGWRWGASGPRVEGGGGHREALVLVQWVGMVMQVVV